MEWISVTTRWPEKDGWYLVYGRYTGDCPKRVHEATFDAKRKQFYIDCIKTKNVTHWMPLPEPPKQ